jgi:hypothetical protein
MASVVTSKGREIIANRLKGTGSEPLNLGWGVPSAQFTAAVSDVALFAETSEARVAGTSSIVTTTTTNDTYQVVGTLTAAGSRAVTECGLFDSTTKPTGNTVAAAGVVGSSVATTLNTGTTFSPGNNNYIQIRTEVMQVTAGSGTTALTVTRGANGSSAISTIAVSDIVTPGNIPGTSAITGGSMLAHYDFAVINLATSDTIQTTAQVKFT